MRRDILQGLAFGDNVTQPNALPGGPQKQAWDLAQRGFARDAYWLVNTVEERKMRTQHILLRPNHFQCFQMMCCEQVYDLHTGE